MSFATSSPNALLADKSWRRRNSRWLWWCYLGFGLLGFVGFLIVAFRVQNRKFWTAAAVAGVGSAASWLATAVSGEASDTAAAADASKAAAASDAGWGAGVALAIWVAQIVYAILINRDYLRWKANGMNEWYNQPIGQTVTSLSPTSAPLQVSPPAQAPFLGVDTAAYFAPGPAPQAPPPPPPASAQALQPPEPSAPARIDINSASPGEIAIVAGVDDALVRRIVDARIQGGGFRGLEDLVAGAGLQPHEMLKFRDKVTFGPYTAGATSTRPEEPPAHPTQPGNGRILDY